MNPKQNVIESMLKIVLILRSLEVINETLMGLQRESAIPKANVEALPLREGDPEIPLNLLQRPPHQDITRELQKIRLP